jgi:CTP:molybdopterin cytidylyltransferase MocA
MVLAADLPGLTAADLACVAGADPEGALIVIATDSAGALGHPVVFDAELRAGFAGLAGDQGARAVVAANRGRMRTVALPGDHATRDLDTPAEWAAWRAETGELG